MFLNNHLFSEEQLIDYSPCVERFRKHSHQVQEGLPQRTCGEEGYEGT